MGHSAVLLITICLVTVIQMPPLTGIEVVLEPRELLVMEGGVAKFRCSPHIPIALPILIRDGAYFAPWNSDGRLQYVDQVSPGPGVFGNRTYSLSRVSLQDNGTLYQCSVANYPSNVVTLSVFVPLTVSGVRSHTILLEGENAEIGVRVQKPPYPISFDWSLNGSPFSGSDRVRVVPGTGSLAVTGADSAVEGKYALTITSPYQSVQVATTVQVISSRFQQAPGNVTLQAGDRLALACQHRHAAAYVWRSATSFFQQSDPKVRIERRGTRLVYGPVDYRDHLLRIHCVVHLPNGRRLSSPPGVLSVLTAPVIERLTRSPLTTVEGQEVTLQFRIHSNPPPHSLTFYHRGEVVGGDSRAEHGDGGTLLISAVGREEGGRYTLVAENELGSGNSSLELIVNYPPTITPLHTSLVAQVEGAATLPCGRSVSSSPPPSFHWRHSSGHLPEEVSVSLRGQLHINTTAYRDTGQYTCTATNLLGRAATTVTLLVLDPPSPPEMLTLLSTGSTWVHLKWSPPTDPGSRPVSGYTLTATPSTMLPPLTTSPPTGPQILPPSPTTTNTSGPGSPNSFLLLSTCVEVACPPTKHSVSNSSLLSANMTGLVPAIGYQVTIVALSNGTNLQSESSAPLTLTTSTHTPALGSVTASVHGPGSIQVTWTLAHSGGLPVSHFTLALCRCGSPALCRDCRPPQAVSVGNETVLSLTGYDRRALVGGLESEEWYVVQMSAGNWLGEGVSIRSAPVLSHSMGVPGPPTQPEVVAWGENGVTIATSLPKLGSGIELYLTVTSVLNGSEVTTHSTALSGQVEGRRIEVAVPNVTYHRWLQFQASASNYLGSSRSSSLSLPGYQTVEEITVSFEPVSVLIAVVVGALNSGLLVVALAFCILSVRDRILQRRELAKRNQMAEIIYSATPPSHVSTLGDRRYSPDGRSNNRGTSCDPIYDFPCTNCQLHIPGYSLPSSNSPVTEV